MQDQRESSGEGAALDADARKAVEIYMTLTENEEKTNIKGSLPAAFNISY